MRHLNIYSIMCTQYASMRIFDVLTGYEIDFFPRSLKSICENIDMFRRHMPSDIINFDYMVWDTVPPELGGFCTLDIYKPNPDNASLKEYPTESDIKREKMACKYEFDELCDMIYERSQLKPETQYLYKVYGSMCHRGFVNKIFDDHHQAYMDTLRYYIELIGSTRDTVLQGIKIINDREPSKYRGAGIYKNSIDASHIAMICKYCELMFNISRFTVATYFDKNDPELYIRKAYILRNKCKNDPDSTSSNDLSKARFLMFKAGYIYGELDNYDKALQTFEIGYQMTPDTHGIFADKITEFKAYYAQYGTSVLSSVE